MSTSIFFRSLPALLIVGFVLVSPLQALQESSVIPTTTTTPCSKHFLFQFGPYFYYSTVKCSGTESPCNEAATDTIHIHKAQPANLGCHPIAGSCACRAPKPDGTIELHQEVPLPDSAKAAIATPVGLAPPSGESTRTLCTNPQGNKWVAFSMITNAKYAKTKSDFAGVPKDTYYYLVEFEAVTYDFDPDTGIAAATKKSVTENAIVCMAIRLGSPPSSGSTVFGGELQLTDGNLRLQVDQHANVFRPTN